MKLEQKYLDHIYSSIGGKIDGDSVQEEIVNKITKGYKRVVNKLNDKGTLTKATVANEVKKLYDDLSEALGRIDLNESTSDWKIPAFYPEKTGERQRHGFDYENAVIQKYDLKRSDNYTSKYDAFYLGIPVQIKCIKHGCAIEMGDYKRNKNKQEDFILIVGFWKGEKDNIVKESILYIDHANFTKHLTFKNDKKMVAEMDLISNLVEDDNRWKVFCNKYKSEWPDTNLLDIRFKRDHKKQKRIQCAISWSNFVNKFVNEFKTYKLK